MVISGTGTSRLDLLNVTCFLDQPVLECKNGLGVHLARFLCLCTVCTVTFQNFCQSLERQLADIRQQFREQSAEYNAVKIELAQVKYCNQDNQDPVSNPQKLQDDFEITIKVRLPGNFLLLESVTFHIY